MIEEIDVNDIPLKGTFVILKDGIQETYTSYDAIPDEFDNVISFVHYIEPAWDDIDIVKMNSVAHYKFKKLMERERK